MSEENATQETEQETRPLTPINDEKLLKHLHSIQEKWIIVDWEPGDDTLTITYSRQAGKGEGTSGQARNVKSLKKYMLDVLKDNNKPMKAKDMAEAVQTKGYIASDIRKLKANIATQFYSQDDFVLAGKKGSGLYKLAEKKK